MHISLVPKLQLLGILSEASNRIKISSFYTRL